MSIFLILHVFCMCTLANENIRTFTVEDIYYMKYFEISSILSWHLLFDAYYYIDKTWNQL